MKKIIIGVLITIETLLISLIIVLSLYRKGLLFDAPIPNITNVYLDDDNYVNINFDLEENGVSDKIFYIVQKDSTTPDVNSPNWKLISGNNLKYLFDDLYYTFLKNEDNVITEVKKAEIFGIVSNVKLNKSLIYLAINATYTPTLTYDLLGHYSDSPYWYSDDENIATVNQSGKITGIKKGETKIHVKVLDNEATIDVVVTNLIVKKPKKYDKSKPYLPCGRYTKEENDLLDKILEDRVNDVGYRTRASVVEAGRFYTLEFPYILEYFNENGRLSGNGIDGEGRYYHKGMYLHKSRFKNITKSATGPQIWGCSLYSRPAGRFKKNGLDCSGFISWILYNGGFDVEDIGAGVTPVKNLTDYGDKRVLTKSLMDSGRIKVGDLLSSGGVWGGHIALIIGIDKKNYYVAESLMSDPNVGIRVYSKASFIKRFYWVMLMDSYYKKDGKLTNMWY